MSEKKIYFDATFLHYGDDLRGIPQVIFQLVRLIAQNREFDSVSFIATKKVRSSFLLALGIPKKRIAIVPPVPLLSKDIVFHGFLCGLRYWTIRRRAALIIHPEYRTVLKSSIAQAVLYYDFIFLDDYGRHERRPLLRTLLKNIYVCYVRRKLSISRRAQYKMTISEYTKQRLLQLYPRISPDTVSVLHLGARGLTTCITRPRERCSSPITFLSVGGVDDPRKNYFALIQNSARLAGGRPFHLHIVGKCYPAFQETLSSLVKSMKLETSVSFHGLVPDGRLHDFYKQADFFLFPSLIEGFGLPMVEAMAQGCIVCAFNNSSIPEIGGDAIVIAENNDFASWSEHISTLIRDAAAYRRLSEKAIDRAKVFSEERMLERYGAYFKKVLGR